MLAAPCFFFLLRGIRRGFGRRHLRLALLHFDTLVIQHALFTLRVLGRHAVAVMSDALFVDPLVRVLPGRQDLEVFFDALLFRLRSAGQQDAGEHHGQEGDGIAHAAYSAPAG